MITIILRADGEIEAMYDPRQNVPHVVIVNEKEKWTDSPSIFTDAFEAEQAEQITTYRNDGYEDRNP